MEYVAQNPEKVGQILNASPAVAQSILQDWAQPTSWADGRALALVAMIRDISLIIINSMDACIEVFSPLDSTGSFRDMWVLHLEADHYNYVHVTDYKKLSQILTCVKMGPMKRSESQLAPVLRGGASVDRDDGLQAGTFWSALSKWHRSDAQHASACGLMIHSINVGGLRSNADAVGAHIGPGSHVIAIQETLCTRQAQRSLSSYLLRQGWHATWGEPAAICRTVTGQWRADRKCPGLVMLSNDSPLYPCKFATPSARKWQQAGRMMLCMQNGETGKRYFLNLYAPAGSTMIKQRKRFLDDVVDELAHWHGEAMYVLGDFQCNWVDQYQFLQCAVHGWRVPMLLDEKGQQATHTYQCGNSSTLIDSCMLSPDCPAQTQHVLVTRSPLLLHAFLSIWIPAQVEKPFQRVAYPPKLTRTIASEPRVHWDTVKQRIEQIGSQLEEAKRLSEWIDSQGLVDQAWDSFTDAYRMHLLDRGVRALCADGTLMPTLQQCGDAHAHAKTCTRSKKTRAKTLYRAIGWLTSLARQESGFKTRHRLETHRDCICSALQLSADEFVTALDDPAVHVEAWKSKLREHHHRVAKRQLRAWHAKLYLPNSRPTRTLYRWLRKIPPVATLTVKTPHGVVAGPEAFFGAARQYWEGVMRVDQPGNVEAVCWAYAQAEHSDPLPHNPQVLCECAKRMRRDAAPGLDCWPVKILDDLTLQVADSLVGFFRILESALLWPTSWRDVRTHLVPKGSDPEPDVSSHRPLSVMTIWYRLWSSYRVTLLDSSVFSGFSKGLCGGIPQRTIEDMIAGPLLCHESHHALALEGRDPNPLHLLSLDASKCFDRITYPSAAAAAAKRGIPTRMICVLIMFWHSLRRFLSVGSYLDVQPVIHYNGVPQGCPISALICNCIVLGMAQCCLL